MSDDCGQSGPCAAKAPGCARPQRNSMEADERLRAVRKLLEEHGCGCPCDHHWTEHEADCERCLACRVAHAIAGPLLCVVDLDVLRQQRDELSVEVNRLRRLESSLPASLRDAHMELEQLRATLADARAAVGDAWFAGGATLAEAIARKCRRLEELGERVERVLEQGPRFTDRHMEAAADLVVEEVREALADLFGWSDRSYLHAVMHVKNAVPNMKADISSLREEAQRERAARAAAIAKAKGEKP